MLIESMVVYKKKAYPLAFVCIASAGIIVLAQHQRLSPDFWIGLGSTILLLLIWFSTVYYQKSKNDNSAKRIARIKKFKKIYKFFLLGAFAVGFIATSLLSFVDNPILFGVFTGIGFSLGLTIIFDNIWLHVIFPWNSKDEKVKQIWLQND